MHIDSIYECATIFCRWHYETRLVLDDKGDGNRLQPSDREDKKTPCAHLIFRVFLPILYKKAGRMTYIFMDKIWRKEVTNSCRPSMGEAKNAKIINKRI